MIAKYWVVDITDLNNSWRLKQEIKDSNCKIVEYKEVLE